MPTVETVTVLITDLVGSTGREARLGPAAADELRRDHFGVLREAIGGSPGTEIKNTGDGLMVVFQGAVDAVDCGIAIQQRIERRNRGADEQLAIRVGIAVGDATCEEDDYFGVPVVEATRLCDKAIGGQILVTELVRLIGGREGHDFSPMGPVELRGRPEPVSAYEVGWEPGGAGSGEVPLPAGLREVPPVGYVGRVDERERVRARWDAASDGRRQALLVSGEAGIGKTRLTTHAALDFHAEGAVVLYGHCAEGLGAPYGVWIQSLCHLVEHAPDRVLRAYVEQHGGELIRLVPGLARRVPEAPEPRETDPETERYLLFSAVVGLLAHASAEFPVVLVLDDLHWADTPTLTLLTHAIAETHGLRLLLLCTYRDSDLLRDHPLTRMLADLRRQEGIERLALRGLSEDEVVTLMEAAAGHELDAPGRALATEIADETDGNPFFVGELLRHLSESGAVVQAADGRWETVHQPDELGLPQSVHDVVGRRVEALGENCRGVLTCAAVIGRDFDVDLLLRIVREDEDEVIDLLDIAVQASVLEERADRTGSFSFAHSLISRTLYDSLGATRRERLHRRVAEALEELCGENPGPRIAELARHWTAATAPVDAGKAVTYSLQAGRDALAKLAPDEAVAWFTQGLKLLDDAADRDVAERCELMIGLGEAQRQAGQPEFRATLLSAARIAEELGDADRMARAALANNRGFASAFGAVDEERVAALQRALELDRSANPARRARLLALQAMELQFEPGHERRRALADEALGLAREADDPRILPYVLRDHFHATWSADTIEARRRTAAEMTELADRLDDPLARIWALDRTVHAAAESGQLAEAGEASARLLALTQELGQPGLRWHATYYAAALAHMRGELEDADSLAVAAARLGEQAGEPDTMIISMGQVAGVRIAQGRAQEIVDALEQASAANPGIQAFEAGLSVILCDVGRTADAAPRLDRAADHRFADVPRDQVYSSTLALWATTATDVGSERAAALLYDLIEPWRDGMVWNGATGYGSVEMYLGMLAATLGSHQRASEHFATASRRHEREDVKGWEAQNLCHRAGSLLAAGAAGEARATAERALALAREHGYGSSARQAEAFLQMVPTA
jgi:class 3 adenylate cyclase